MHQERAWRQAHADFAAALTGSVWFQMFAAASSAVVAAVSAVTQPGTGAPMWKVLVAAVSGAMGGFLLAVAVTYFVVWARAPYAQRNSARGELAKARRTIRRLRNRQPVLRLGPPHGLEKEWLQTPEMGGDDSRFSTVEVTMFRIPVHNSGYACDDVTVRVIAVEPAFPDAPGIAPIFHLHPPLNPHESYFHLAKNDDAFVDFIGYAPKWAGGSWWLASTAARDGFIYYEDELHSDEMRKVTVEVLGGGKRSRREYAVWINQGYLDVMTWEDHENNVAQWRRDVAASGLTEREYIEQLASEEAATPPVAAT